MFISADRIINGIETAPYPENTDAENITEKIGIEIASKETEEELISYISTFMNNCYPEKFSLYQ